MATLRNKRNSLPSLTKFFVSKRASIFECQEESSREKRERSPCGLLESSERKLEARKSTKKKLDMARKRRQMDPYREESTEIDESDAGIEPKTSTEKKDLNKSNEIKPCGHARAAVNLKNIKRSLNHGTSIGACTVCLRARTPIGFISENGNNNQTYEPVIWMCTFCGHQGCDRKHHKHALHHYLTPRSDPHCIAVNTREWTVWCYKCDNEVLTTSCKKVDEALHYLKNTKEVAPTRVTSSLLAPKTNLTSQYSGSDSRLHLSTFSEDSFRSKKVVRKPVHTESAPKVKGLSNLGNTCFFNSVMQNLSQTHFLSQLLDKKFQSGQKIVLPGRSIDYNTYNGNCESRSVEDSMELKPLEIQLTEGGPLSLSFTSFLKEMSSTGKNINTIMPEQLFSNLCKKSTQFDVLKQQDAHELLRCFLDGIRNEEISRMKRGILKAFALTDKTHFFSVSDKLRNILQGYGVQASHTIIEEIFSGHFISTVICEQCKWSSQKFEPFLDVSLPINEEKGKPKCNKFGEDENVMNFFGKRSNEKLSKHQLKKQKNAKKRGKQINTVKWGDRYRQSKVIEERRNRRLTEKRRPEDAEDLLQKQEDEKLFMAAKKKSIGCSKGESANFKKLVKQKSLQSRPSDGESPEEELEYDYEDDDDESFGTVKHVCKKDTSESSKVSTSKGEEDESERDVDNETDENGKSLSEDSSPLCQSKETSDADVEDNNDSDIINEQYKSRRQPSIVIEESLGHQQNDNYNDPPLDHRLLSTCASFDLFCTSTSDTERYYTAAGGDTMDELDVTLVPDNISVRSGPSISTASATSGKGDSVSISSGEALGQFDECKTQRKRCVNEITFQVNDMKIMSDGNDSLLDEYNYTNDHLESVDSLQADDADNIEEISMKIKKEWMAKSLSTLAPRYQTDREECSILSCLNNFTTTELLTGSNKISCENCTRIKAEEYDEDTKMVKSSASKQLLILSPPAVLTLQLKRFQQVGCNLKKVNRFVQFPLVLDLAPFTSSISVGLNNLKQNQSEVLYALYGIVQHSGRLDNGHYVAYVRSRNVDPTRLSKRFLNTKPSSEYKMDKLIEEMAQKEESLKKSKYETFRTLDKQEMTEEVRMGRWFCVSDSIVSETNIDKVMKAQAYILFYERIH